VLQLIDDIEALQNLPPPASGTAATIRGLLSPHFPQTISDLRSVVMSAKTAPVQVAGDTDAPVTIGAADLAYMDIAIQNASAGIVSLSGRPAFKLLTSAQISDLGWLAVAVAEAGAGLALFPVAPALGLTLGAEAAVLALASMTDLAWLATTDPGDGGHGTEIAEQFIGDYELAGSEYSTLRGTLSGALGVDNANINTDMEHYVPRACDGSYTWTCSGCVCGTFELTCEACGDGIGGWLQTSVPIPCNGGIANCSGHLVCGPC
jgi:hypothetical protein